MEDLVESGDGVVVVTPKGRYPADLVIFATGFSVDFGKRPEFAALRDRILLWRDVYSPPAGWEHAGISAAPYLGPAFEFRPKPDLDAATADAVSRISCFAYPAVPSHGKITSGIPSISEGRRASRLDLPARCLSKIAPTISIAFSGSIRRSFLATNGLMRTSMRK